MSVTEAAGSVPGGTGRLGEGAAMAERKGGRLARSRRRPGLSRAVFAVLGPLAFLVVAAAGYVGGGFVRFAQEVTAFSSAPAPDRGDAIVVLTGGALRIDKAVELLIEGRARRLLISGVNPGTGPATLARMTGTDPALFDCCIDLDYAALDTVGNARSAARWAAGHGFDHLIVVTSDYHMPRSLREFQRADGELALAPYTVRRADLWRTQYLPSADGLRVLLTEYAKLLGARFADLSGIEMRAGAAHLATPLPGLASARAETPSED